MFPQGVVVRLNALLRKAVNTKSTAEVTSLADQIIKMIEEEKEKEEQKPQNGQDGNNQQNAGGNQPQNSQGGSGNDQNQGPDANGGDQQGKDQKQDDANGNLIRKDRATKASRILMVAARQDKAGLVAILTRRNKTRPKCSSRF